MGALKTDQLLFTRMARGLWLGTSTIARTPSYIVVDVCTRRDTADGIPSLSAPEPQSLRGANSALPARH